jgi:tetratricopeptide (TPR) repeat protein
MKNLILLLFTVLSLSLYAQTETDIQLAQHYYLSGDFEKAASYYEKIYANSPTKVYFNRYYDCLMQLKDYKTAEKLVKKHAQMNKGDGELKVLLGSFYEDAGEPAKAQKVYQDIVSELTSNPSQIINTYQSFVAKNKMDFAKQTLDRGRKLMPSYPFNFQYADFFALSGNKAEMVREYLDYLETQPMMYESIQAAIAQRTDLSNSEGQDFLALKEALIVRAQKNTTTLVFSEMLVWLFIQNRNFSGAYSQVVALDKRNNGDGGRVYDLGGIALENKDYETARKCFNYVLELGPNGNLYLSALKSLLGARYKEITTNRSYKSEEINDALKEYDNAIQKVGKSRGSVGLMLEYAHILAYYADKADKAIETLNELLAFQGMTDIQKAQIKMKLADVHVLGGDIWEASLLYMQVDNDFKFESIGNEAKFKNARIFYYDGEFNFAQSQLNVLKESTSKLISNDAMQLSILITDNFGLDSNFQAMSWFAQADLLIEQHKYPQAFSLFDSIQTNFPFHSLADDILFKRAQAMELQGQWEKAIGFYEDILKFHKEDILADDALFRLGDINENVLNDKEKALGFYRQLIIDFKGSLFSAEAAKRVRTLRGDKVIDIDEL